MPKKLIVFFVCAWLCFVVGFTVALCDWKDTRENTATLTINESILSYEYDEDVKHAPYLLDVHINGQASVLEIPSVYISKFNRTQFEATYTADSVYTLVVLQSDYETCDPIPVVGLKNGTDTLLNEADVLNALVSNAKMGMIFCAVGVVGIGVLIVYALYKRRHNSLPSLFE